MTTNDKPPGNPAILLRLPPQISKPLNARAKREGRTVQAIILELVAESLGVKKYPEPVRGGTRKDAKSK